MELTQTQDTASGNPAAADNSPCRTCGDGSGGDAPPAYVYALGRIEVRFPSLAVEKEFAQAIGRTSTAGQTDQQAFHAALSKRENLYLVRQLCWVFSVQGIETYLLRPRHSSDYERLVEAVRPQAGPGDIDAVIGINAGMASPSLCNGLMIPLVVFDQIYSFDRPALIKTVPKPTKMEASKFTAAAEEVFDRIRQLNDNAGATDEHRALNYLAMRCPSVCASVATCWGSMHSPVGLFGWHRITTSAPSTASGNCGCACTVTV